MIYVILDQKFDSKKFTAFYKKKGYEFMAVIEEDREQGICDQIVVLDAATNVKIYYMEDYLIDLRYLVLEGRKADQVSEELHQSKDLQALDFTKIEKMVKGAKNKRELVLGLRMLAVLSPKEYDPKFFKLFKLGLEHKDPQVRFATIQIVTYPKWTEIREFVNKMAAKDLHPEVRGISEAFVKQFDQLTKRKSSAKKKASSKKKTAKKAVKKAVKKAKAK